MDKKIKVIFGKNSVKEALLSENIKADKLYLPKSWVDPILTEIRKLAEKKDIPWKSADKQKLDELSFNGNHQGAVLKIAERDYASYEDLLAVPKQRREPPFFLGCFQIQDPHNLGALIRTADGAGVHGLIIPKNKATGLTHIVSKTSSGADAYVPVCRVNNLYETVLDLKSKGIKIIGTCPFEGINYRYADYSGPVCILIGAEGRGLDRRLLSVCDEKIKIPLMGQVESLNASVAGGLVMYEAMYSRMNEQLIQRL